ncbi:sterol 26-hydroxylase, mitochondrial [Hippoglossus hippoglossus]|uniref:sterol 26-hydroxylase, mitochondrial n=1 Tax=Hippoglossus hippoglossus TaxID=8267 RepID=UPI00148D17E3|nr:sterol 26-hydroxylase, mitochondrial [Hippoglossus hippoglossus]
MNVPAAAVGSVRLSRALQSRMECLRTLHAARRGAELRPGASSVRRNVDVQKTTDTGRLKTIDDLPGPSVSTNLYWMLFKGYSEKMHLMQVLQKNLHGPIWRSKYGSFEMVNVASSEFIAQVIRQEGRYPVRVEMSHWKDYMDLRGHDYGLHVSPGPDWYQIRKHLNPKMLKLGEVSAYASTIQQVVGDMVQRIEVLRCRSQDQATVPDMAAELYKFGFEAVSSILFETRLGCLQEDIPKDTLRFIAAVNTMFKLSDAVLFTPRWSRSILPIWKRFVQAWDVLCSVGQKLIDKRMAEIEAQVRSGEQADGLYLSYLLSSEKMSRSQIYITITELLLGGVDTTSNTLTWTLYHLARDERAQELLYGEVNSVCPNKREPTTDDLKSMPYLRAVIKETLRLYPVVPGNGRYVTENEVIVGDYWFPKKTQFHLCHFAVCHDEAVFPNPEQFVPERWLRSQMPGWPARGFYKHQPYSYIPFGVGVRACLGKRVAEMEMHFALLRLMQHYKLKPEKGATVVHPKTRVLMVPEKPINLRFLPRSGGQ